MKIFILLTTFFFCARICAQESVVVAIGEAELEKDKIYFSKPQVPDSVSKSQAAVFEKISEIVKDDLFFYRKYFRLIGYQDEFIAAQGDLTNKSQFNETGVKYVLQFLADNALKSVNVKLFNVTNNSYDLDLNNSLSMDIRQIAHEFSSKIYEKITGKKSIFNSKLYFVTDKHSIKGEVIKELYQMDFDGENKKRITFHNSIVVSPDVSFQNDKVIYTLYSFDNRRQRHTWLYTKDLNTMKHSMVSNRKGLNSGAIFEPNGRDIILTLTHTGNAEIYEMNLQSRAIRKITNHYAIDVDPSLAKGGQLMAFLSGRSGKAMIYTLDPRGTETSVKRIGYNGKFNGTPRFSRDGLEIVYSSWLDNRFDLFRIDRNGNNSVRLTKDFGSNEDPTFSPDNEFIAFSSQRVLSQDKAETDIWIIDREGEVIKKLTHNFGNCITPRWSK